MDAVTDPIFGATWYAATAVHQPPRRRTLAHDLDVDVCIIGGGLAGLTAARELARRGWSVALLEARRVAWNASGRNAGFVLPGFGQDLDRIVERVGRDDARKLWALAEEGKTYVRRTIRADRIKGANPKPGWLEIETVPAASDLARHVEELNTVYGAKAQLWPAERVRAALASERYFAGVHYSNAFHIDPLAYANGLAAAAEAAGARIYEDTPALAADFDGIRKRVTTPRGRVRAEHVVLAAGAHMQGILPPLEATLQPVWSYVAVTERLGEALSEAVRYPGAVSEAEGSNLYRVVDGDRLLWCARITPWPADPARYGRKIQAEIARAFPRLGRPAIAHAWSGVFGNTVHRMPQIGMLRPGVWVANGFSGHGLNTTAMAGNLVAAGIAERDDRWRLFLPFELIWAGGAAGRLALQGYIWSRRFRARVVRPFRAALHPAPPRTAAAAPASPAADGAADQARRGKNATPAPPQAGAGAISADNSV